MAEGKIEITFNEETLEEIRRLTSALEDGTDRIKQELIEHWSEQVRRAFAVPGPVVGKGPTDLVTIFEEAIRQELSANFGGYRHGQHLSLYRESKVLAAMIVRVLSTFRDSSLSDDRYDLLRVPKIDAF